MRIVRQHMRVAALLVCVLMSAEALPCMETRYAPANVPGGVENYWWREDYRAADVVFEGEVTKLVTSGDHQYATFRVLKYWKTDGVAIGEVRTLIQGTSCDRPFELGVTYIQFASRKSMWWSIVPWTVPLLEGKGNYPQRKSASYVAYSRLLRETLDAAVATELPNNAMQRTREH
jgi:hypothetical protein